MGKDRLAAVILAAGKGTRMKSELPKVLHAVAGVPMLKYPVGLARELGCAPTVAVIGHGAETVETALAGSGVLFALQSQQLGTGHALLCAEPQLAGFSGTVLLLCGDVPLLRRETLEALLHYHQAQQATVTVLTAHMPNPHGYGRIVRQGDEVLRIVEEKDAGQQQRAINEINTGIYALEAPFVFEALKTIGCDNAQGEYYLTDVLAAARRAGRRVCALAAGAPEETMGINDRVQLAEAGALMRQRINRELMLAGVTLVDPATSYIEPQVRIGADCIIEPNVQLRGATVIGRGCRIDTGVCVDGCTVGDGVHLKAGSVMTASSIGDRSEVGPMAHLRPGTVLVGENKIGNFVETKQSVLGQGSKASHLTYIGDAEVGRKVNIGCGTITCNYDGVNKHKTIIEDEVFVGSDTQFVAPVRIGRGALIGAGSTITRDVPADALALSRPEQKIIEGWAAKQRAKQQKK